MALRGGLANTGAVRRALKHRGWVRALGLVLFGRAFRGSCFWVRAFGFVLLVVLFVVRGLGSCFLVVLFVVRSSGRSFVVRSSGSCFWGSYVFFVRCFKILRGVCGKVRGF